MKLQDVWQYKKAQYSWKKTRGGKGMLIDGVPGVAPGHIVVVGAGNVGTGAIRRAVGLGARVTVLDIDVKRLTYLNEVFMGKIETSYSNNYNVTQAVKTAEPSNRSSFNTRKKSTNNSYRRND